MKRVLHLVRTDPAALPPDVLADHDVVVYTSMPASPPRVPCYLWLSGHWEAQGQAERPEGLAGSTSNHVQIIDSAALCELIFRADTVAVW